MKLTKFNLSYSFNADGYMLYYKSKPIGGAGVMLPRERPLHWRHAKSNRIMFSEQAQREIASLIIGKGESRFIEAIKKLVEEEGK